MKRLGFTNQQIDDSLIRLGGKFIRIDDYINAKTKQRWKKSCCGEIVTRTYDSICGYTGMCWKCDYKSKLDEHVIDSKLQGRNITRLSNLVSRVKLMSWGCKTCSYEWKAGVGDVISSSGKRKPTGCPRCAGNLPLTNETIDGRLKDRSTVRVSDYSGKCRDKMSWACKICHNVWKAGAENVVNVEKTRQTDCPKCFKFTSKKEGLIYKLLEDLTQLYPIRQYKIKGNIYNSDGKVIRKKIEVDFFIEKNGKKIIIEANGPHHYVPVKYWNWTEAQAIERLKSQKIRDEWLKSYCKCNDIYFIEINYMKTDKQSEIYQFLKEELGKIINLP